METQQFIFNIIQYYEFHLSNMKSIIIKKNSEINVIFPLKIIDLYKKKDHELDLSKSKYSKFERKIKGLLQNFIKDGNLCIEINEEHEAEMKIMKLKYQNKMSLVGFLLVCVFIWQIFRLEEDSNHLNRENNVIFNKIIFD